MENIYCSNQTLPSGPLYQELAEDLCKGLIPVISVLALSEIARLPGYIYGLCLNAFSKKSIPESEATPARAKKRRFLPEKKEYSVAYLNNTCNRNIMPYFIMMNKGVFFRPQGLLERDCLFFRNNSKVVHTTPNPAIERMLCGDPTKFYATEAPPTYKEKFAKDPYFE